MCWTKPGNKFESALKGVMLLMIGIYRSIGTAHLGGACRFEPCCSEYALEAFHSHRAPVAFVLMVKRILRCRPGGPWGFDPVPAANVVVGDI
jgi:putative membrane protein insertion efficiency factor